MKYIPLIDIGVPQGTPILVIASGTVVIGTTPTFGQFVALNPESTELNPNGNLRIITSHMSRVVEKISLLLTQL